MIKEWLEHTAGEELIIQSLNQPKHKPVVLKNKEHYFSSQNAFLFEYFGHKFVAANLCDLRDIFHTEALKSTLKEYKFYLFDNEPITFDHFFVDANLQRFYAELIERNSGLTFRCDEFNRDARELASFAIFEYRGARPFYSLLQFTNQVYSLAPGNELHLITNAFALSFKALFAKAVHKTICATLPKHGVYLLDFKGYPEIEGSLVYKNTYPLPVGIVVPGIFHKNKHREYVTIAYSLAQFFKAFKDSENNSVFSKPTGLKRINYLFNQLSQKPIKAKQSMEEDSLSFWRRRTVKIATVLKTGGISTGTGVALTPRIILTNKHIVKEESTASFAYFEGVKFKSAKTIEAKGCLDIGFMVTEEAMPVGDSFDGKAIGTTPSKGDLMMSIGYPVFEAKGGFDDNPFVSRGTLISSWAPKETVEPILLLTSNLIFNGNSGGGIYNSKGQLVGLTFANLCFDSTRPDSVINELALSINLSSLGGLLASLQHASSLDHALSILRTSQYMNMDSEEIRDAMEFYQERGELIHLIN